MSVAGRSKKKRRQELRKLMILLAMLAMVLVLAVPAAIAQVGFGAGQGTDDTGEIELATEVAQEGNNSTQCVAPTQFGNTGNLQNFQGFLQYDSELDDVEFGGTAFSFAPEQAVECTGSVEQAAAASN
jgi:hypothetical protein